MNPSIPRYERGASDAPCRGALLPPDSFSRYRNSEISKLNSLRDQIFQRAVLFSLSSYVCYKSFQSIDSEKSLWSISMRTTFLASGLTSLFSFSTGLQKYFEYIAASHALAQKIEVYPRLFSMKERSLMGQLITAEEFQEISFFLPAGIESIEIFADKVRTWEIEGGEMRLGTFTFLKAKEGQIIESNEELLFRKNRPWIELTLFAARSPSIPNETKKELICAVVNLIIPGQFPSDLRSEKKTGEIRFFSRQLDGQKCIIVNAESEIIRFTKVEALKAFLKRKYP